MSEPLRWNESFSVGHRGLDAEHRRMIDLINQICLACAADGGDGEPGPLLRQLEDVTELHFEHEETLLEELHAGMASERWSLRRMLEVAKMEHAAEHSKRLDELADIARRALHAGGRGAKGRPCEELKAWFVDHAIAYEAPMKTIIQSV